MNNTGYGIRDNQYAHVGVSSSKKRVSNSSSQFGPFIKPIAGGLVNFILRKSLFT